MPLCYLNHFLQLCLGQESPMRSQCSRSHQHSELFIGQIQAELLIGPPPSWSWLDSPLLGGSELWALSFCATLALAQLKLDKPARLTIRVLLFLFLIVKSEVKKQTGRRWHCLEVLSEEQEIETKSDIASLPFYLPTLCQLDFRSQVLSDQPPLLCCL